MQATQGQIEFNEITGEWTYADWTVRVETTEENDFFDPETTYTVVDHDGDEIDSMSDLDVALEYLVDGCDAHKLEVDRENLNEDASDVTELFNDLMCEIDTETTDADCNEDIEAILAKLQTIRAMIRKLSR